MSKQKISLEWSQIVKVPKYIVDEMHISLWKKILNLGPIPGLY